MSHLVIKYLPVGFLVILMFLDYYLTLVGQSLFRKKYAKHFRIQSYELNPMLAVSIGQGKRFNFKHILRIVSSSIILVLVISTTEVEVAKFFTGIYFGIFLFINSRHISSILTFRYAINHPESLSGEMHVDMPFAIRHLRNEKIGAAIMMLVFAFITLKTLLFGAATGIFFQALVCETWVDKWKKQIEKQEQELAEVE